MLGQKCVSYLRHHKLGRATFIMLDKISYLSQQAHQNISTPQNVPRLFDLITCPAEYKNAFYFALRDTLVAPDLETAMQVAYGRDRRWRVVTLAGEVIDRSGTSNKSLKKKQKTSSNLY